MARLAVLLLVVATLLGCSSASYVPLADWTLDCAGCTPSQVHLPANVDRRLAPDAARYTLHTDALLPPALRGRELTLTLPKVYALGRLRVGDQDLAWRPSSCTDRGTLDRPATCGASA